MMDKRTRQLRQMLSLHEKAASAYRRYGEPRKAAQAERLAQKVRDQLREHGDD